MTDDVKLPSTRQILESDAAAKRESAEPSGTRADAQDDESFRRVISALRVVLQMGGSPASTRASRASSSKP